MFLGAGLGMAGEMMSPRSAREQADARRRPQRPPGRAPARIQAAQPQAPQHRGRAAGAAPGRGPRHAPTVRARFGSAQVLRRVRHSHEKHCTNCNASLSPTAKFCAECGTPATPPGLSPHPA